MKADTMNEKTIELPPLADSLQRLRDSIEWLRDGKPHKHGIGVADMIVLEAALASRSRAVAAEGQKPTPSGELSDASRLSLLNTLAQHRGFENATKALASIPLAAEGQKAVAIKPWRDRLPCAFDEADSWDRLTAALAEITDLRAALATPPASMADAAEAVAEVVGTHNIRTLKFLPAGVHLPLGALLYATPGPRGENAGGVVEAWQPIETAPKDGTRFLAVCGTGQTRLVRWADYGGDRYPIGDSPGTIWDDHPTHWMPLPPAPDRGLRIAEKGES